MFDIKAHKPQNKIRFYIYECDTCQIRIPLTFETNKCNNCESDIKLLGSFWVMAEYCSQKDIESIAKANPDDISLFPIFKEKIKDWGEITSSEKELKCNDKNKKLLYNDRPDFINYIVGYLGQRNLFGLPDLSEYKKKLNKRSNGSIDTSRPRHNQQIATDA